MAKRLRRDAVRSRPAACAIAIALGVLSFVPRPAPAGTSTISLQPLSTVTNDGYLREDNETEKNNGKPDLDLQASSTSKNWNVLVHIPVTGLAGKTVLQAWLRLSLFSCTAVTQAIDARVYPLTEDWSESSACWLYRSESTPWTTPGGTHGPAWSDRRLLDGATPLGEVAWQVGPILEAWQTGDLAAHGFVLAGDRATAARLAKFSSSENATPGNRPRLVITYTDEPPAIRNGAVEVQPRALQAGSTGAPLTLWLDVNALDAAPSGMPTGFDALTLQHRGGLVVTGVDRMLVDGSPLSPALVSWTDDGSAVTFRFPKVAVRGRVRLDLRVDVPGAATATGLDLPVLVDDSSTPGALAQALGPGDADGIAGDGDDWVLVITDLGPSRIEVCPDTAAVVERMTTAFEVLGEDRNGNRFPVVADSFAVLPDSAGSVTPGGLFRAARAGLARVVAHLGNLEDTARVAVSPARTPALGAIALQDRLGGAVGALAPGDTMLIEVPIGDGDGFQDVRAVEWDLHRTGHAAALDAPAQRAVFRWERGAAAPWTLREPGGSSWALVPALCSIDTASRSPGPQTVRLAFVAGRIARASAAGEWNLAVRVISDTPPDTSAAVRAGIDAAPLLLFSSAAAAEFSSAAAGSERVPLSRPASGAVPLALATNAAYRVMGRMGDLAGVTVPAETLFVRRGAMPIAWSLDAGGMPGGAMDTSDVVLATGEAPESEAPIALGLHLWADYADTLPPQSYAGGLRLAADLPAFALGAVAETVAVRAVVVSDGLAAHAAAAEVLPHDVTAGAVATLDAYLLARVQGTDTGVNLLRVAVPPGFGVPVVTGAWVGGAAAPFTDQSGAGEAVAALGARAGDGQAVRVRFRLQVPTAADSAPGSFAITFDDTATAMPAQAAAPGDANGVPDGDSWQVRVVAGPPAHLVVEPAGAVCPMGSVVPFAAAASDAHGNPVLAAITWTVEGAIGSVDAAGRFTALRYGDGRVIAASGAVADTAEVTVAPGLAAGEATAEVLPRTVTAGAETSFDVYLLPRLGGADTGVNWLEVALPEACGAPTVTGAWVGGAAAGFADHGSVGRAIAVLERHAGDGQAIRVRFRTTAPALADGVGADWTVRYDDDATPVPAQAALEGDANGVADGDSWRVRVVPGPPAALALSPDSVSCAVDSVVAFALVEADAFGNAIAPAAAWSVTGGIGSVDGAGVFLARHPGRGLVIAAAGSLADTAQVTVQPPPSLAIRTVTGPAAMSSGQAGQVLGVALENRSPEDLDVTSATLGFLRPPAADASGDFTVEPPSLPLRVPAGSIDTLRFAVGVRPEAAAGTVLVGARAAAVGVTSGAAVLAAAADTQLVLVLSAPGIGMMASQAPARVLPGDSTAVLALTFLNRGADAHVLRALRLENRTTGAGDEARLDAAAGVLALWRDDGDGRAFTAGDSLLATGTAARDTVRFASFGAALPAGRPVTLLVTTRVPLAAREGDTIDLRLAGPADVELSPSSAALGTWPLDPAGAITVSGLGAAQVRIDAVPARGLSPGSTDQVALALVVPPDGDQADVLERVAVVNQGTARAGADLAGVALWADDGDGAFDRQRDRLLGRLTDTGDRWQRTGLAEAVGPGGLRLFFTVDVQPLAAEGRTVQLAVPAGTQAGLGLTSGRAGPLDRPLPNPEVLTVTNQDRVTFSAVAIAPAAVRPPAEGVVLLELQALNTCGATRTLTRLRIHSAASGPGTREQLDAEISVVDLRADGDGDGRLGDPAVDPVLASGYFEQGAVDFAGLQWTIPAGATGRLFVTGSVSARQAAGGDVLGATLSAAEDVAFREPAAVAGAWPVSSGAAWTVTCFGTGQVDNFGARGATLSPGDGPVLALDLLVPANGYRADVLRGLRVVNLGRPGVDPLAAMQLWKDGGDGVFTGGTGDDALLGTMTALGEGWQSPLLATPLDPPGARLFVSVSFSAAAPESALVRLAVPVDGIECASGNLGPADRPIVNPDAILISTSPLLARLEIPAASTVGQSVTVRMILRNVGDELLREVTPTALDLGGSSLALADGPAGAPLELAPGASDTIAWTCTGASPGELRLEASAAGTGAASGNLRRAPRVSTSLHHVFARADRVDVAELPTMPASVNRGQQEVVPFSLTFSQPGGGQASDVRVRRLRLVLEDESGAPVSPARLLDRVSVNEGTLLYGVRTAFDTTEGEVSLPLSTPAVVSGTHQATLNLRLGVLPTTVVPGFRVVIPDSGFIEAEDATSGAPVSVRVAAGSFPIASAIARVVAEATAVELRPLAQDTTRTAPGTRGVPLARVRLVSPGVPGISSDVRVTALGLVLTDGAGQPLASAARLLAAIEVSVGGQPALARPIAPGEGATLALALSPPVNLPAGVPVDVLVAGDLSADVGPGTFGARLADSSRFEARDANTRSPVAVLFAAPLMAGGLVHVETLAESLLVAARPALGGTLLVGQAGVTALEMTFRHPGAAGTGAIRLDSLRLESRDQSGRPRALAEAVARLRLRWNGAEVAGAGDFPASASGAALALPALRLEPGDSARAELLLDVSPGAPVGSLELVLGAAGIHAADANTATAVAPRAMAGSGLPAVSGMARIVSPARLLSVGLDSRMPAALAGDGRSALAAVLTLTNADSAAFGPVLVDRLELRAASAAGTPLPVGAAAAALEARVDGHLWAAGAALGPDSVTATLLGERALELLPGRSVAVEIRLVTRPGAAPGSVRLGCDAAGIGVVQPGSALLAVAVQPRPGQSFPLWSEAASFTASDLAGSWSNFPNPFAAGRGGTTFAYYLRDAARVTLRVLDARGALVATLLRDGERAAGLRQEDRWDGRNGRGDVVVNGVYVAELEVRYGDGTGERVRRKLAVVR